jgi:hypothetical protein
VQLGYPSPKNLASFHFSKQALADLGETMKPRISSHRRRSLRAGTAMIVAMSLFATACSDDDSGSSDTTAQDTTETTEAPAEVSIGVELVDYPDFTTDVMATSPDLLESMAFDYASTLAEGEEPEMERFLFGYVPVEVFNRIFDGDESETSGLLWLMWLSGYFGGRWLRGEIEVAQPGAPLTTYSKTPDQVTFDSIMATAKVGLDAAAADDATVLEYARESLYDKPPTEPDGDPIRGLTDNFGYNKGYMLQILEVPPEGLEAGPAYQITCGGLFDCAYATPRLTVLTELAELQAQVAAGEGEFAGLAAELKTFQDEAEPRGRMVWSSGLSVKGFPQKSYDQLLDVSSSFLETVQATALVMIDAAATENAARARTGAIANAAMGVWLSGYRVGLIFGDGDKVLPTFTTPQ